MNVRSWKHVFGWTFGLTFLLLALAIPMTKAFEPEESLIDIAIQSSMIGCALCLPVFGFISYQSLQLNRARDELAKLVNRDRLTNVATRNYFYARMADNPDGYGVSLMVDIDHFKQINDTYGHFVGDAAIARVAKLIEDCIRPEDIVCRFGGEEFVVFLSEATRAEGEEVAERIRQTVEDNEVYGDNYVLTVTVSIGGSLVQMVRNIEDSIRTADEALYRAKRGGRNRVEWGSTPEELFESDRLRDVG